MGDFLTDLSTDAFGPALVAIYLKRLIISLPRMTNRGYDACERDTGNFVSKLGIQCGQILVSGVAIFGNKEE